MKILLAADIFPPQSGGPATYVVTLANELLKRGHAVEIVSLNPKSDRNSVSCNLYPVTSQTKLPRYIQYFRLLLKHAKDVDVVYAMGPVNAGVPAFAAARLRGKKFVVKVVGDYAWEQHMIAECRMQNAECVMIDEFQYKKFFGKIGLLKWAERFVCRRADRVIVPSRYLKKIVEGWGAESQKIQLIYNDVECGTARPIIHENETWLVTAGRLVPWKGMSTLVDVIADLSKQDPESRWRLKIVGDGPEMENIRKKIKEGNASLIVELTGNLPKEKTLSYIASADVFILNSAYEGLSHVLMEAHTQGVPVLASSAGGNPEIVSGDSLFEYNNKKVMVEKILNIRHGGGGKGMPHAFRGLSGMIEETEILLKEVCASS